MLTRYNKAPFPWFGGKSQAAPLVWSLLGDVEHYVEPFAGALGVLLERPHPCNRPYHSETINDLDGFVVNAWRSIQQYPEETAQAASWPVTEYDKQARQIAVLNWHTEAVGEKLAGSAQWCDPRMAGWWLYGVCCQIGAVHGRGPWNVDPLTGRICKRGAPGTERKRPHLNNNGMGVNHAGLREAGVLRDRPHLNNNGMGVNHAGLREAGVGAEEFHPLTMPELLRWFQWLSARLRHVRIVNGDWRRVCKPGALLTLKIRTGKGSCGVFVDPPYSAEERDTDLYHQDTDITASVRDWALKAGEDKRVRIVVAGYDTEHTALEAAGWSVHEWFKEGFLQGGYGKMNCASQQARERLWASPACLLREKPQMALFSAPA